MSSKQTVVQIVACRGPPEQRSYLVHWDHEIIGSRYEQDLSKWFDHDQKGTNNNYGIKKVIGGPFQRLNESDILEEYYHLETDLNFIKEARKALDKGEKVTYYAWY